MPFSDVDASPESDRLVDYLERAAISLEPLKAQLRARVARGGTGLVLDLGCGAGHDLAGFDEAGVSSVGLEPSRTMLARASSRRRRLDAGFSLVAGRGEELPLRTRSVRGCLADRVLQHVPEPERVLAEVVRVLRPGGSVAIFEPDWGSLTIDADDQEAVEALVAQLASGAPSRRIGLHLRRLLVEAGFMEVTCRLDPATPQSCEALGRLTNLEPPFERMVSEGGVSGDRVGAFRRQLEERSRQGCFFATLNRVIATAQAPGVR